jgi:hypothetical protein
MVSYLLGVNSRRRLILCRTDAKPVSIVALGCFHPVMKVQSASIHFFLGSSEEKEDSDDEEDDVSAYGQLHFGSNMHLSGPRCQSLAPSSGNQ